MSHGDTRSRRVGTLAGAATLALALAFAAGCTGGDSGDATEGGTREAAGDDAGPVIAPGRPGETAETLSPEAAGEAARDARAEPNAADFAFMSMMIDHHRQALVMTDLAEQHASDGDVRRLAERIGVAQEPEIQLMTDWLDDNADSAGDGEDGEGHRHHTGTMPGMATQAQLDELRAARGEDFDALFLDLMITHHEGAVEMTTSHAAEGSDTYVVELAADLAATQGAEIDRLAALR